MVPVPGRNAQTPRVRFVVYLLRAKSCTTNRNAHTTNPQRIEPMEMERLALAYAERGFTRSPLHGAACSLRHLSSLIGGLVFCIGL